MTRRSGLLLEVAAVVLALVAYEVVFADRRSRSAEPPDPADVLGRIAALERAATQARPMDPAVVRSLEVRVDALERGAVSAPDAEPRAWTDREIARLRRGLAELDATARREDLHVDARAMVAAVAPGLRVALVEAAIGPLLAFHDDAVAILGERPKPRTAEAIDARDRRLAERRRRLEEDLVAAAVPEAEAKRLAAAMWPRVWSSTDRLLPGPR